MKQPLVYLPALALLLSTIPAATAQDAAAALIAPGAEVKELASGMKFTEGPVWLPKEQKLVFSDIPNSRLMQWSEADGLSLFRKSEQANGNILDLEGRLISCQHLARNLVRTETDGSITVLAEKHDGKRFNSPNDVTVHSDGSLWFTDPPWGLWNAKADREIPGHYVYKLDPRTGKLDVLITDLPMPNGINFSPDETRLYVADTGGHRRHPDEAMRKLSGTVSCYEVTPEGNLGKRLFHIKGGSDGMALDVQGNLYTTHGKVHIYDKDGEKLGEIETPQAPANVSFGGKDFKTLFITARSSLYAIDMAVTGAKPKGAKW